MTNALQDFAALLGGEVEEVGGLPQSDDFAPMWDYRDVGTGALLAGRYDGIRKVKTENGERNVHVFKDASIGTDPKELEFIGNIDSWGTTVLDDVLSEMGKGQKVLVVYEGQKDTGRKPHIFRAYRAKGVTAA
jgi:hypothetical protein